jgi:uncharacterized protein
MNATIVVFAKAPIPGHVKTRMQPFLGPVEASRMYEACLRDIVGKVAGLDAELRIAYVDVPGAESFFDSTFPWLERFPQPEGDLGARMAATVEQIFRAGREAVLILGADVPTLPRPYIREALAAVERGGLVFGPALDGGYYLVGMARDAAPAAGGVFRDIPWSTPEVLNRSLERAAKAGLPYHLLPPWYDIDEPADLERAGEDVDADSHLRRWLRERK